MRHESDVETFLSEHGCAVVGTVHVPLDGGMPVGDFLGRIEAGDFSFTWNAHAAVKERCVAALRSWASERFDPNAPAFGTSTTWKAFARNASD